MWFYMKYKKSKYEAYLAVSVVSRILFQAQWLVTGRWFSPSTLVSSTNETDRQDIAEILLEFEPRSRRGVLDTTLCDKVC
jgi:hypothetical protein